jgi:hypothetical protein
MSHILPLFLMLVWFSTIFLLSAGHCFILSHSAHYALSDTSVTSVQKICSKNSRNIYLNPGMYQM